MPKYKVKLIFKYSDTVEVEAETKEKAIKAALEECDEQFDCFYDAEVERE